MSNAKEQGAVATPLMAIIILAIALVVAVAFAAWAYQGRQDFKDNVSQKVAAAVATAKTAQAAELQNQFDQQSKQPFKTYQGPTTYGSVSFKYPKTWDAYVDETDSSTPVKGYWYPNQVPGLGAGKAYALRVNLVSQSYSNDLQRFEGLIKQGKVKATAYVPPQMVNVTNVQIGSRLDGQIEPQFVGSAVLISVRDKTLEIYTESNDYLSDFNNVILANLTFIP